MRSITNAPSRCLSGNASGRAPPLNPLSPAINDTFTGLTCLDWLSDALVTLARTPLDLTRFGDESGSIRLVERPHSFAGIVHSAYEKIRQSGVDNPAVTIRLMESIARVARVVDDPDGRAARRCPRSRGAASCSSR